MAGSDAHTAKPDSTAALGKRLWRDYLARYWLQLAIALVAMGAYAASVAMIPLGLEWIVSGLTGEGARFSPSLHDVVVIGPFLVIGLGAINALAQYWQGRSSADASLGALRDIQCEMFDRLLALDFAQVKGEPTGQIISRFTNDMTVLRTALQRIAKGVKSIFELFGLVIVILTYDILLALVFLAVYAIVAFPVARIGAILRKTSREAQAQAGDLTSLVGESVDGARMVKAYQIEPLERARAGAAFDERLRLLRKMAHTRALNEPVIFFAGSIAVAIVLSFVAFRMSSDKLDFAQFSAFVGALLLMSQPARALGTLNAVAQEGLAAFERMLSLIDMHPMIVTKEGATDLPDGPGAVRLDQVSFDYGDGRAAVSEISLEIPAGAKIALVGESGAGKSTLMNLLPRLYEASAGRIFIDGHDITSVSLRSLRARMALVSQDAILFDMSALENIAFGKPGANRADIIKAAEAAAANDFIAQLADGYDTRLGEGGANLSGGQRQRVALARAFLKDAPILLLDEATSALDAESEAKIQEAFARLTKGRTSFVIAHRLSTVKDADMIIVMEQGRIVETGTHDELIKKDGAYARQAALQFT